MIRAAFCVLAFGMDFYRSAKTSVGASVDREIKLRLRERMFQKGSRPAAPGWNGFPLPSRPPIYESTSMSPVNDPPIAPVTIEWGSFETLNTVSALALCLLRQWPDDAHNDAYVTALMVCDAVLAESEEDTAEDARASFIAAAHEAGLSVSPDDAGPDWF